MDKRGEPGDSKSIVRVLLNGERASLLLAVECTISFSRPAAGIASESW